MYPIIQITLSGKPYELHTNELMYFFFILFALIHFIFYFRKTISIYKLLIIYFSVVITAILGSRIFHLLFERKVSLVDHFHLIFSDFNGMTFYGGFLTALLVLVLLAFILIKDKAISLNLLDYTALLSALGYGVLRIACFLNGCCWGKFYSGPLSVQYFNPSSAMPALGLPVFPVQLLDSIIGFTIFFLLKFFGTRYEYLKGYLLLLFILFYSLGRFITEFYRGDNARGVELFLGLSTSQLISVGLFIVSVSVLTLLFLKKQQKVTF